MAHSTRRVGIIGYDGINALDLTGPAEAFASAECFDARGQSTRCYEILVIGVSGKPFVAESGIVFHPATRLEDAPELDTIIVPGGVGLRKGRSADALAPWLVERSRHTRRIASVCTGAYALARAGLLDGRRATTHWRHAQDLRERFPAVLVDADALFVKDGNFYTGAGVTAGIDLALALIEEDFGARVALSAAREMVVYVKRLGGQNQYSEPLQFQTRASDAFSDLVSWMLTHLDRDLSVGVLAERAHLGTRHFSRRFKSAFNETPAEFVLSLRLAEARRRLALPRSNVDRIATSIGFRSAHALRRAFEKRFGLTPRAYRDRFGFD
ncbi:MAG TPA: GlxA family transcriptional regulator [Dokdonella sp.]|nr:GlxA family transcriptional regulator [Dokdonella sp.]